MTPTRDTTNATEKPVVLVVEDEPDVAETYEIWLAADYDVRIAESGPEALEQLDETVDVVLLDRMMPGMSGDEVLAEIQTRELGCLVAMVSAVDPDFDIIEMGFDDYITKPPTRDELKETVSQLLDRGQRAERVQTYRSLLAKQAALQTHKGRNELEESDEYDDLKAQIEAVRAELQSEEHRLLDDSEFLGALRTFEDEEP